MLIMLAGDFLATLRNVRTYLPAGMAEPPEENLTPARQESLPGIKYHVRPRVRCTTRGTG